MSLNPQHLGNPAHTERAASRKVSPADREQLQHHPVSLSRVAALFAPHWRTLLGVVALISVSSAVTIVQPFLVREIIDVALPDGNLSLLGWLAAAMIGIAVVSAVIGVIQTWMSTLMGQRVMHSLRVKLFTHLQAQSLGFFTRTRSGEVQSRLTHDVAGMQQVVTNSATGVAANLTTVVATFLAMLALSPALTLISLVVLPLAVWIARQVARMRRRFTDRRQQVLAELHTQVEEGLSVSGAQLVKTLGTADKEAVRFDARSEELIGLELSSQLAGRWRMATLQVIFAAIPAVIYFAAGMPFAAETMTIGTVVAFTALQGQVFRPIMGLMSIGVQWVTAMAFFSRIFEYLDLVPELLPPKDPVRLRAEDLKGVVEYRDVSFSYGGQDKQSGRHEGVAANAEVLHGVTLRIEPGRTVALVGPTGSGKSTLASLLPRLADPSAGTVSIDGISVDRIETQDLAQLVGVVSQDTYLIHASIRQNLLVAKPEAEDAELWSALASAELATMVRGLPEQLDTLVGARGHRLSGGEKQRLAIARTILRNPPILVLDEATSALDNTTEALVQKALDRLSSQRTTLMIAHRLDTVMRADEVHVLREGRIVESGPPGQLLQNSGEFAELAAGGQRDGDHIRKIRNEVAV